MDLKSKHLMDFLNEPIQHLDTSGFELLEILDVRSQLASREPLLNDDDKMMLEKLDLELLQSASDMSKRISEVANLAEMRKRAHVLPSHWWWYLDQMQMGQRKATA